MAPVDDRTRRLIERWAFTAIWVVLPFLAGPAFAASLDARSTTFRTAASIGLWLVWGATVGAALVARTVTLTAIRIVAPAAVVAAGWAALATPSPGPADAVALCATALALAVALAPGTGDAYVNGSSYGDERRLPLRAPVALLLGPIELSWLVIVAGTVMGPLLLAAQVWVPGVVAVVIGWPAAWWTLRTLHGLSRRWLVFTPAGVVVHDQMVVLEAVLMLRRHVANIGPAPADSAARDLTMGAPGLALQIDLTEPLAITPRPAGRPGPHSPPVVSEDVSAVVVCPSRPGVVLTEARRRHLPVGV